MLFFALHTLVQVPAIVALIVQFLAAFSTSTPHAIINITVPGVGSVPRHLLGSERSQRDWNEEHHRKLDKNSCTEAGVQVQYLHVYITNNFNQITSISRWRHGNIHRSDHRPQLTHEPKTHGHMSQGDACHMSQGDVKAARR